MNEHRSWLADRVWRGGAALATVCLMVTLGLVSGCSDEAGKDDTSATAGNDIGGEIADNADGGDTDHDGKSWVDTYIPPVAPEFWVLYARSSRLPGAPDTDNDLVLTDSVNPGAIDNAGTYGCGISPFADKKKCIELTKYAFKKAGTLNCNHGCVLSPDMKFIAIATGPPDVNGLFTYRPGTITYYPASSTKFLFIVDKFEPITKVKDLHFAGPYLFYSTPVHLLSTGVSQYEIRRRNVVDPEDAEKTLTLMAPATDPDANPSKPHTTYSGRFRVSENGETLLFLTPTIRSLKVWSWTKGTLTQHDYICENPLGDNTCVGTGSQYDDNDPAAISPDGKEILLFTIVGRYFRVRRYTVGSTADSTFTNIITLPANATYLQDVCLNLPSWMHAQVKGTPQFSADGKTVYFLGLSKCSGSSDKEWTDIMSMKIEDVGKPVSEKMFVNFTNNTRDSSPGNRWIRSFVLSPKKDFFVFSASPTYNSGGEPFRSTTDKRQLKDTEIYTMPVQSGATMVQITNEGSYDALGPTAYLPLSED